MSARPITAKHAFGRVTAPSRTYPRSAAENRCIERAPYEGHVKRSADRNAL